MSSRQTFVHRPVDRGKMLCMRAAEPRPRPAHGRAGAGLGAARRSTTCCRRHRGGEGTDPRRRRRRRAAHRQGRKASRRSRRHVDLPFKLDELQMRSRRGAVRRGRARRDSSCAPTTSATSRASRSTAPEVVELGVLSALSFKLYTADRTAGALNLFALQAQAFGRRGRDHRRWSSRRTRRRRSWPAARVSSCSRRCRRGTASARPRASSWSDSRVDDVRAFEMLRQLSQDSNTKLIDVAQRVIDTRGSG